jgi:hypothetical protein
MSVEFSISDHEGMKQVSTDMGIFCMTQRLFDAYLKSVRTTKKDFKHSFGRLLARATVPESYPARNDTREWFEVTLDDHIRALIESRAIEPRAFLNKYHEPIDKTSELWDIMTPDILDMMATASLFHRFSGKRVDRMIYLEHTVIGGTTYLCFQNPFMSGYSPDESMQQLGRVNRQREILDRQKPFLIGLILYMKNDEFQFGDVKDYFSSGTIAMNSDQSSAKQVLEAIYAKSKGSGAPLFDGLDYVRVVLAPVQYDEDLIAIPKPIAIDFIADRNIIYQSKDVRLLSHLKPKKQDLNLADTIENGDGPMIHIGRKTKGKYHLLSEIPKLLLGLILIGAEFSQS